MSNLFESAKPAEIAPFVGKHFTAHSVKASIAAFFDGGTNGEDLLHALYDHVLSEPIPNSMRKILQQPQRQAGNKPVTRRLPPEPKR
jgi:hypothetical protein